MFRRLTCLLAACAVLIFVSAPAFAVGMAMGGIPVIGEVQLDVVEFADFACKGATWFYNAISHGLGSDTCAYAPTLGGRHKFSPVRTLVNGQVGFYYQCEYCGRNYGDALDEAYQGYLESSFSGAPSTKFDSNGNIPVSSSLFYFNSFSGMLYSVSADNTRGGYITLGLYPGHTVDSSGVSLDARPGQLLLMSGSSFICFSNADYHGNSHSFGVRFTAPCDGYLVIPPTVVTLGFVRGAIQTPVARDTLSSVFQGTFPLRQGQLVSFSMPFKVSTWSDVSGYFPTSDENAKNLVGVSAFRLTADFSSAYIVPSYVDEALYASDTRVAGSVSGGGSFGYVQDGQLYQSSVDTIYNETTNIYSNPVTGDTSTISAWSYDYSDRSYSLTTNEGDSISVTYGDSSVVINEGGTTYNVYYLVEEPEDVQEDTSHTHSFSGAITTPPTCTGTGVRTLTCTECGWQTTETVPATGHSYSASVVTTPPTCMAPGVRTGTCTLCGDEATEPIPALGHDYSSVVTLAPSCVASGVRTFTCSRCGDAYTASVPATGHIWQSVLSVPTQYDDVTGELVQAGFTLYRCSNCGEEYRIDAASGGSSLPSASGGGASTDGGGGAALDPDIGKGFLPTIAQGIGQDLPGVLEASSGWFSLFPGYYSGWAEFLRDGIACLPPEAQSMISFGFGVVAFLGLLLRLAGRR